jgi:hypothetical protein
MDSEGTCSKEVQKEIHNDLYKYPNLDEDKRRLIIKRIEERLSSKMASLLWATSDILFYNMEMQRFEPDEFVYLDSIRTAYGNIKEKCSRPFVIFLIRTSTNRKRQAQMTKDIDEFLESISFKELSKGYAVCYISEIEEDSDEEDLKAKTKTAISVKKVTTGEKVTPGEKNTPGEKVTPGEKNQSGLIQLINPLNENLNKNEPNGDPGDPEDQDFLIFHNPDFIRCMDAIRAVVRGAIKSEERNFSSFKEFSERIQSIFEREKKESVNRRTMFDDAFAIIAKKPKVRSLIEEVFELREILKGEALTLMIEHNTRVQQSLKEIEDKINQAFEEYQNAKSRLEDADKGHIELDMQERGRLKSIMKEHENSVNSSKKDAIRGGLSFTSASLGIGGIFCPPLLIAAAGFGLVNVIHECANKTDQEKLQKKIVEKIDEQAKEGKQFNLRFERCTEVLQKLMTKLSLKMDEDLEAILLVYLIITKYEPQVLEKNEFGEAYKSFRDKVLLKVNFLDNFTSTGTNANPKVGGIRSTVVVLISNALKAFNLLKLISQSVGRFLPVYGGIVAAADLGTTVYSAAKNSETKVTAKKLEETIIHTQNLLHMMLEIKHLLEKDRNNINMVFMNIEDKVIVCKVCGRYESRFEGKDGYCASDYNSLSHE